MEENRLGVEEAEVGVEAALVSDAYYAQIRSILETARQKAYAAVNREMVHAYWRVGESIVEQLGEVKRAQYGSRFITELSARLTKDFGRGFTPTNLRYMRLFYLSFPIHHTLRDELSWSHYRELTRVSSADERMWYMNECADSGWSTRQLKRQIDTRFHERLLASRDKESVAAEIQRTEQPPTPRDIIRDPYVLEFLDLPQPAHLYESNMEQALIDHLQEFMLELGRGFSFVARQKRISFDGRHFYIDLVFYNYLARCFVLVDLKTADLTHQDIGQMQMYVNYYTRELMNEGDNHPIGILLCADKSDSVVRYTLPEDNRQIFASKCLPYLPTEEELAEELNAEYRALEEARMADSALAVDEDDPVEVVCEHLPSTSWCSA
ncbi:MULTISPECIES: YhcG family protein [unclassified Adlercreutzia]|uniref:PDDEXK nuclease domain-containing protein n=1 Tax=unclassified Adlercreutzia TaxID=2636013 RepID=UPI00198084E1|nr:MULTISPECIES: PDDEXK nuclease domain-containing protein [unclassified Adlercreutzia]